MCAKARTIFGYYKRSITARARLQEIQKQLSVDPPLELVLDVPTRWNSEFAMLARLLKLKTAVTIDLTENDSVENLTNGEWRQVSAFVTVLQPVEEATTAECAESYPTLSLVVPLVHCMKLLLCDKTSDCDEYDFAQNLLKSIKARLPAVSTTAPNCLATLLDPRFKDVCYGDEEKVEVRGLVHSVLKEMSGRSADVEMPADCSANQSGQATEFAKSPHCPQKSDHGGLPAKSAEEHILSFLWYAANKACIRDVAGRFEVSESTHHRMMSRVTSFLLDIAPNIIKFPSDLQKLAKDFEQVTML
ncbi:hypothetical protein HPB52_001675 [Rhipicephalus sanguineus]|uniref:Uncharacterized protein n=1 Tax=Rhipicephalus sanguineus TaxID=34632 RepID=A0A9D4PUR6_RHISA|nr:hypothetical protein HPB52_001675 [Rhipicephalus sanguineus]